MTGTARDRADAVWWHGIMASNRVGASGNDDADFQQSMVVGEEPVMQTVAKKMAAQSGTVTLINSAFLQEVKEAAPDPTPLIRALHEYGGCGGEDQQAALAFVDGLGELRDTLRGIFELEETYGYVTAQNCDYRAGEPRADRARMQHRELYLMLHETLEQVEECQYRGTLSQHLPEYCQALSNFEVRLREHEALEEELIERGLGGSVA
ncbi:MAG: hypothetical protein D6753_15410 [Planctomycetota bacterium]|nr:MAG: hypothetical protein D6753_15410 [Planctomycetota bacterium]